MQVLSLLKNFGPNFATYCALAHKITSHHQGKFNSQVFMQTCVILEGRVLRLSPIDKLSIFWLLGGHLTPYFEARISEALILILFKNDPDFIWTKSFLILFRSYLQPSSNKWSCFIGIFCRSIFG